MASFANAEAFNDSRSRLMALGTGLNERNAITDRLRTRIDTPGEQPDRPSGEPGPPERAESGNVSWREHRALDELPGSEREVIELAYWSGFSQSEVAEYLHIPLGTVKTRTRTALAHLADVLDGELL